MPGVDRAERPGVTADDCGVSFREDEDILKLCYGDVCTTLIILKKIELDTLNR